MIIAKKNAAYYLSFPAIDSTTPASYKAGVSPVDTAYYKDGAGAWTTLAITDTATEIGSTGVYEMDLTAAEMNHDKVIIKFAVSGMADDAYQFDLRTKLTDDLNDVAATDVVSNGAIDTTSGAVDTVTTNTDMRGTNSAATAAALATVDNEIAAIQGDVTEILADTNELQTDDVPGLIAALDAVVDTKASQASVDTIDGEVGDILADTAALQADWANGGRLELIIDQILADTGTDGVAISATVANELADALLNRDMSTGTDSGSTTVRTVRQALRFLRNKWAISGTTLTVNKEDDSTASWTAEVSTSAAADPVTGSNPAGGA